MVAHGDGLELLDRRTGRFVRHGHLLAVEHVDERIEEQEETGATGVDHSRILQDGQQIGRARERVASGVTRRTEDGDEIGPGGGRGRRTLG